MMEPTKTDQKLEYIPNAEMRRFVKTLFMDEVAGRPYRAQKITGIERHKYYRHLEDPQFVEWIHKQRVKYHTACGIIVDNALMKAVEMLEVSAIRTFYELEGRLSKGGKNVGSGGQVVVDTPIIVNLHYDSPKPEAINAEPVPGENKLVMDSETKRITI